MTETTQITEKEQDLITLFRTKLLFLSGITMLDMIDELPKGFNSNIIRQTKQQLERFNREVIRTTPKQGTYFDKNPSRDKQLTVANMIDLLARIGYEESSHTYDSVADIALNTLDSVYYFQKNRKTINFGKYRALFELIEKELKADLAGEHTSLIYLKNKKQLALLLDPEVPHEEMEVK